MRRHIYVNKQSTSAQVPTSLQKPRRRQNDASIKTYVGIYVGIAECRREILGELISWQFK